ncbi:unnamed protein product [Callosobruchus maculatus]|uniref:PITH domain-containing protein n=1 Tax=Callosobruchus maculatus TaxID=64391 RepID=A0A653BTW7_CALMS|nr:unnamed protein product [Callosobruchus maculatus]
MAPHGHGKCCGDQAAAHSHDEGEQGIQYSLYAKINKEDLECLNETTEGSGKLVFKPWEDRLNFDTYVESDVDEELLFNIPFTGNVKLKGIKVIGGDEDSHPARMRIFKNRPGMTFDEAASEADQEFELVKDSTGVAEYATKIVIFQNVHHLTLHFPRNFGAEKTKIYYIGLKGEWSEAHHHGVTICTYEARPMADDHPHKSHLDDIHSPPSVGS